MKVDLTPEAGYQVEVFGHKGRFEILKRDVGADGQYRFRLQRLRDGFVLEDVRYPEMNYPPEERVRRALPQILAECGPRPEDFQEGEGTYEVQADEMYDGTPRVMVKFHLKPEVIPSVEKARIWNDFFAKLNDKFLFSMDVGSWLQFSVKEYRSMLRAAS